MIFSTWYQHAVTNVKISPIPHARTATVADERACWKGDGRLRKNHLVNVQLQNFEDERVTAARVEQDGDSIAGTEAALFKRESPTNVMGPRIRIVEGSADSTRLGSYAIHCSKRHQVIKAQTM